MERERRQFIRQSAVADVRLYHPALSGCLRTSIEEWSPAAIRLCARLDGNNGVDFSASPFQLEAESMDIIFSMQFVRWDDAGLVLRFVEEGKIVAGGRRQWPPPEG